MNYNDTFNPGDTVKVTRKAISRENGWCDVWSRMMDPAVGKTGTVISGVSSEYPHSIEVKIAGIPNFYYPDFVLKKIEPKPVVDVLQKDKVLAAKFNVGDKVRVHYSDFPSGNEGKIAVVQRTMIKGFVTVKFDHQSFTINLFPQRLTLIESVSKKPIVTLKNKAFFSAVSAAVEIAKSQGTVNADQVQAKLADQGFTSKDLGNAAGVIFRGKNWKKVGSTKSTRKGNNFRTISTWQYVGA